MVGNFGYRRGGRELFSMTDYGTPMHHGIHFQAMTAVAHYDNGKATKEEIGEQILEQYNGDLTQKFYQIVMGGGSHNIHYGIYRDPSWSVGQASQATIDFMLDTLDWMRPIREDSRVLDLGSGQGGAMHTIAKRFNCFVQGFNLVAEQNEQNLKECEKLGIRSKVDVLTGNLDDGLPEEWTETFDAVFSCEVLYHLVDRAAVINHVKRVLKPGGVFVFSDIMGADNVNEEDLKAFTDRNAVAAMSRPKNYIDALKAVGLQYISWTDLSHHLLLFHKRMLKNVEAHWDELKKHGASETFLGQWKKALVDRHNIQDEHKVFAWGVFCAAKL